MAVIKPFKAYRPEKGLEAREFDSCIFKKYLAGRIKPAFFVSTFLFLGMLFYVIV